MLDYQRRFLAFSLANEVIKFGKFTLKSGRVSPYFFNSGAFQSGQTLAQLGLFYAAAIEQQGVAYDMLFGPAYKGIPLVVATSIALATHFNKNVPYCFNRKEVKDHGEGGSLVGAPLQGKVLLVDDVITAGTAVQESVQLISQSPATLAGVVIALDRQERGIDKTESALQSIYERYHIPAWSIVCYTELMEYLQEIPHAAANLAALQAYRQQYGVC